MAHVITDSVQQECIALIRTIEQDWDRQPPRHAPATVEVAMLNILKRLVGDDAPDFVVPSFRRV